MGRSSMIQSLTMATEGTFGNKQHQLYKYMSNKIWLVFCSFCQLQVWLWAEKYHQQKNQWHKKNIYIHFKYEPLLFKMFLKYFLSEFAVV